MILSAPVSRPARLGRLGPVLAIAGGLVAIDQLTKWWALERLDDGDIDVLWTLRFHLTFNQGSAFGLGDELGPLIAVVSVAVIAVLLRTASRSRSRLERAGIGLLLGGATGNLLDRVFRADGGFLDGAVVDFIDFQWWPVFNVADVAITVGVVGVLLWYGRPRPSPDGR